jgi:uncharacterized membrane protein YidH (DUF202 family)
VYVAYEGFRVFIISGSLLILAGGVLIIRYLHFFFTNQNPAGHLQSLIIASILVIVGFLVVMLGLLTDLVSSTRKLTEESLGKLKEFMNCK